jgi:hypothetical protein
MFEAYGIQPTSWNKQATTIAEFPKNPKYMPLKDRIPFLEALYARHKEKTGNEIK